MYRYKQYYQYIRHRNSKSVLYTGMSKFMSGKTSILCAFEMYHKNVIDQYNKN